MKEMEARAVSVVLLCGGLGSRWCSAASRPKPTNDVLGMPMIRRVLDAVLETTAVDELTVVTSPGGGARLRAYLELVYPAVRFVLVEVPYQTRGPAETALLGLRQLQLLPSHGSCVAGRQLLLLDNDCVYQGLDLAALPHGSFLVCTPESTDGPTHFSYVAVEQQNGTGTVVVDITERHKAGDDTLVCMGGYGFADIDTCMRCCRQAVMACPPTQEPYMSSAVRALLASGGTVAAVVLPEAFTIGTPLDVSINSSRLRSPPLDSDCSEGMLVPPDDAPSPPFRSMRDHVVQLVPWPPESSELAVQKTGPRSTLEAETAYYLAVAGSAAARHMFPELLSFSPEGNDRWSLVLERVRGGARLSDVYAAGLLSADCMRAVVTQACALHDSAPEYSACLAHASDASIRRHYLGKLEARAAVVADYPFPDARQVLEAVRNRAHTFLHSELCTADLHPVIHGDLWFSNVLLSSAGRHPFVFIDPRARFDGRQTTSGHRCYDWAKMYMSIAGLDVALDHGADVDGAARAEVEAAFWGSLAAHGAVADEGGRTAVRCLAAVLMHGTFFSYGPDLQPSRRELAWTLLKRVLAETGGG
jgi:hypothetical protein